MSKKQTDYCEGCNAECCRYFTVPLDKPEDRDDFDAMHWYILHEGVSIHVDDEGDWYVNVVNRCRALGENNLCAAYDRRPEICRDHNDGVCEKNGVPYDFREQFSTPEELMAYAEKFLARREAARTRRSLAAKRVWKQREIGEAGRASGRGQT